ncbi:type II toxin-antitoxin system PemK/MazF family toxin [Paenibacillus soyae]|mgnify:CR=1 FL=1|uniref:type II toxin-antitoxin system PemK/MazF family toxin n=1 Tax=Paenibacillus soyae TaxID=2969249 RepID=UPI003530242B
MFCTINKIQQQVEKREIFRGDLFMCNLPNESGSIQANYRPVVVLQNNTGNHFATTTIVAPLSKKGKNLPTHVRLEKGVGGLLYSSYILCEQIRTINQCWLDKYVGTIDVKSPEFNAIYTAVLVSLGFVQPQNTFVTI